MVAGPVERWPFEEPPDAAASTRTRVLRGEDWIHQVYRALDGATWKFEPHGLAPRSEPAVVPLREIVALDPSVAALADLPPGWYAWRDRKGDRWQRARRAEDER